jgi:hypothetical protein
MAEGPVLAHSAQDEMSAVMSERLLVGGFSVDTQAAGPINDDVKETARHRQVFVEMDHVAKISDWEMYTEGGAQADESEQPCGPPRLETDKQRQAAEDVKSARDPDSHVGKRYVDAREILGSRAWIAELNHAVPDKQTRHQQTRECKQVGLCISHARQPAIRLCTLHERRFPFVEPARRPVTQAALNPP